MEEKIKALIAGIGGASLGTEILKCLSSTGRYKIYGCDISPYAYGHYTPEFEETFVIERENYIEQVLEICKKRKIQVIIPGAEETTKIIGLSQDIFEKEGIKVACNSADIILLCSNKWSLIEKLSKLGIKTPKTFLIDNEREIDAIEDLTFPCVIKPAEESGGSIFTFIVGDKEDAKLFTRYLLKNGKKPIIQEYITADEGEFSITVLSGKDKNVIGTIAMKRFYPSKLSIAIKSKYGLISSSYSQGEFDEFQNIREQAENIAILLGSSGPLNIQARVKNGIILPFEINPRFSATTWARALAGFNDVDIFIRHLFGEFQGERYNFRIKKGIFLRSLTEIFVEKDKVKAKSEINKK